MRNLEIVLRKDKESSIPTALYDLESTSSMLNLSIHGTGSTSHNCASSTYKCSQYLPNPPMISFLKLENDTSLLSILVRHRLVLVQFGGTFMDLHSHSLLVLSHERLKVPAKSSLSK
jgi:hypothetical protein